MMHKKLANNTGCPRCGEKAETIDNVFRECPGTMEVWKELSILNITMGQNLDFAQWLTWVFDQFNPCQCRLVCYAIWAIWGNQNRRIHENKVSTGKEIAGFINNYITEITGYENKNSVKTIEAIACREAVQIGVDKEWRSIIIEGDSLAIIKKCNLKSQDRSLSRSMLKSGKGWIESVNQIENGMEKTEEIEESFKNTKWFLGEKSYPEIEIARNEK
ncbi:hypothetical protein J1N35_043750 [Gossypium stocksii]|uniref:RNase H type-1 domain-containing protein n=1 Tax=Gossypium stocksii TaxID=47602 RepID=A0A9D3U871_9ROSI|nr:hypothetical protein J1N35_043750 [Gossypium stocksii]